MQTVLPAQILPQLVGECCMGLGYYEDNGIEELEGVQDWAAALENKAVRYTVIALQFLRPASAVIAGIHGYRRHDENWGAAIGWGAFGFIFPVLTPGVALIQGYGRDKSDALFGRRSRVRKRHR